MREGFVNHIYYKVIGVGEPLVMISGLGADHQAWALLLESLSLKYQCIVFDNRGAGKSLVPEDSPCTIEKMAEDVAMLLAGLQIKKANIIGHSMGGYIAQVFAANHPNCVHRLVLIATKAKSRAVQKLYQEVIMDMVRENIPRKTMIKNTLCWLFSNAYLSDADRVKQAISLRMMRSAEESRKTYFYQVEAVLDFDVSDAAQRIVAPTLIVSGEQDMLVALRDAQELRDLIPGAELDVIEGMGHMPHVEVPAEVYLRLMRFLSV